MSIKSTTETVMPPFWMPMSTGRLYDTSISMGATTTVAMVAHTLYASPVYVPNTVTASGIGVEVTSGSAGTNARLGIYRDSTSTPGTPGALLLDAGTISGTSATYASIVISQSLTPGWYWLAIVSNVAITVRALTTANSMHALGFSSGTDTTTHTGVSVARGYAALPDPFTAGFALSTVNFPRVMIQV